MKALIACLCAFLISGCMTIYEVHKSPDGSVDLVVRSFREFEQPKVHYDRNGDTVTFDFGAATSTTGTSPVENAIGDAIRAGTLQFSPADVQD